MPPPDAGAPVAASLAERIAAAERAVIRHDAALRQEIGRVSRGSRQLLHRHARSGMAAGGVLLLGLLWWRSGRRRGGPVAAPGRRRRAASPRRRSRPRMQLLARLVPLVSPVLAPLLGARLRVLLGPQIASLVMAVALPAVTRAAAGAVAPGAFHGDERGSEPETVPLLDLQRLAGDWHEMARLPGAGKEPGLREVGLRCTLSGRETLSVTRHGLRRDGSEERIVGSARRPDPGRPGRLQLSFAPEGLRWLPGAWADCWVLHLDDDGRHALLGSPDRERLWLLSRSPQPDDSAFHRLASLAARQGYAVHRLVRSR